MLVNWSVVTKAFDLIGNCSLDLNVFEMAPA